MATGLMPWAGLIPPSLLGAAGTVIPFAQATAPVGWVAATDAAHTDAVMRCTVPVSYTGTSGANAVGPLFVGGAVTDGHVLTIGELASHSHTIVDPGHVHSVTDPQHNHTPPGGGHFWGDQSFVNIAQGSGSPAAVGLNNTANASTGISLVAAITGISASNNGSNTAHTHSLTNFNYKMVDYIICTKS